MRFEDLGPLQYLLVKVASRCNISCNYCYWFRDGSVYGQPKLMSKDIERCLLDRVSEHISTYGLREFSILLHGGEPLLFGIDRFRVLLGSFRRIEAEQRCTIDVSVTTNGTLVTPEWAALLARDRVAVSLSLDGKSVLNDARRTTFSGEGTYAATIRGLKHLEAAGLRAQLLAVSDPTSNPEEVVAHFADELRIEKFDVMIPDVTCDDSPDSVSDYYKRLFDVWYDKYSLQGVEIRFLKEIIRGLLGGLSKVETTGLGPVFSATLMPNGALEPLDVARIAGEEFTRTELNVRTHAIQDLVRSPLWQEMYTASLTPHAKCRECSYLAACGGGYLPHRFSQSARFNNPSVYCDDLLSIFAHVEKRIFRGNDLR